MKNGMQDVINKRKAHFKKGYTTDHDVKMHSTGTLARMAACYAMAESDDRFVRLFSIDKNVPMQVWPYYLEFDAKSRRDNLVTAAALLIAEIDRLDAKEKYQKITSLDGTFVFNFEVCKAGDLPQYKWIEVPEFYIIHKENLSDLEVLHDSTHGRFLTKLREQLENILRSRAKVGQQLYVTSRNGFYNCDPISQSDANGLHYSAWIVSIVWVDEQGLARYYSNGDWLLVPSKNFDWDRKVT